jgi:hypothetical protein
VWNVGANEAIHLHSNGIPRVALLAMQDRVRFLVQDLTKQCTTNGRKKRSRIPPPTPLLAICSS